MGKQRPDTPREDFAGPEAGPEAPYPIMLKGPVIKGFGRGSRELGIPTANIPPSGLSAYPDLESGVYFGFVGLKVTDQTRQAADNSKLTLGESSADGRSKQSTSGESTVYPAVLSIGYNPFYANPTRSIEIHILHHFHDHNFYHSALNLLVLGFIRPEYDYNSLEALISDIKTDCDVARRSLEREGYQEVIGQGKEDGKWLRDFTWWQSWTEEQVRQVEAEEVGKARGGKNAPDGGVDATAGQEKL
ncbi:Riboflavin kinase [Cyphellophora attinorum]|uniref:Riboflavin kinase n=1 Tax=Cyphellophora attinorum TaxID=1664694 RepID=A0A0N1NYM7_9EURO|nr:Riboflavin kinase [Phialophora attinorum]KPI40086.1 Riboflavin kinase [Phialophora attinorum]